MSPTYRTTVTSAFPRPEALVRATRDLDRGRISAEDAERAFARAESDVTEVERSLSLDGVTRGHLRWDDLFRPFTEIWHGVSAGPLTRFFETNTFYRKPVLESAPRPGRGTLARWMPDGPRARGILPGPWTFAQLCDVRYGNQTSASGLADIARALASDLASLEGRRPTQIQFQEPMLAYAPFAGDPGPLVEAYRTIVGATGGSETSVWTFFGDVRPPLALLGQLPVDVVGVDLLSLEDRAQETWHGKGLGLGVFDGRSTTSESADELARLVRGAAGRLRAENVWLGPSPPLDLLPFDAAVEKLGVLPELKAVLSS